MHSEIMFHEIEVSSLSFVYTAEATQRPALYHCCAKSAMIPYMEKPNYVISFYKCSNACDRTAEQSKLYYLYRDLQHNYGRQNKRKSGKLWHVPLTTR